ncbi:hypothetical protein HK099_005735 [Clydaea vesicula]|uniref:Uncharacterized protein n=1 Tax=Clydaea vesicula TaxID=447962 RepID=A0AAD5TZX3_9FUNG|nr:hypothetical protein HK099_005735 [Clydaea vesicula]
MVEIIEEKSTSSTFGVENVKTSNGKSPSKSKGINEKKIGKTLKRIKTLVNPYFLNSPVSTIQISAGFVPSHKLLFHPRLALSPTFQVHRIGTSFLILGHSAYDVFQKSAGIIMWQMPLERAFNAPIKEKKKEESSFNEPANKSILDFKKIQKYLNKNKFLKAQLIAGGTLVTIDLLFYRNPVRINRYYSIFPYSLYPSLEFSMRWLWAATETATSLPVLGIIPVPPIYTPIIVCALGGFRQSEHLLKGLIGALAVGYIMDLRRSDGSRVVDWMKSLGTWWFNFITTKVRKVAGIKVEDSHVEKGDDDNKSDDGENLFSSQFGPIPMEFLSTGLSAIMQLGGIPNSTVFNNASGPSINFG